MVCRMSKQQHLFFGFKLSRARLWVRVLREEGRRASFPELVRILVHMVMTARHGSQGRAVWRRRVNTCRRCILFDRNLWRCRPFNTSKAGCGCFIPLLAAFSKKECWGYSATGGEMGWPPH